MRKVFIKDICNILLLSLILTLRNQLSTICAADGPPFLSRKELRFASFPFLSFRILIFYKEKFLFTPAIPLNCTASRIRQDSCRPMSLGSYRPANLPIRTDSKQSLRPFPFLSRTGNVLQAFLLQSFCILAFLKENIPLPDSNLNSHLSNLYFSLVTRLLNSLICLLYIYYPLNTFCIKDCPVLLPPYSLFI